MAQSISSKIRVIHVVNSMAHGGIETFLVNMLRNYDRSKFHMDILYTGPDPGDYALQVRDQGSELIACPLGGDQIRFMGKFRKIIIAGRYAAVNSHIADMGAGALLMAKLMNVPARVASYHSDIVHRKGPKGLYMNLMRKIIIRVATDITTSSPYVATAHFDKMAVSPDIIHPISYGVDTEYFSDKTIKPLDLNRFGFNENDVIVGHVGHYTNDKNHTALLKIADIVVKEIPGTRFLLCGTGGTLRENVENDIMSLGLSENFAMVHGLEDIRKFYNSIDAFMLPSRFEGMPVSIIEAQAAGKAIVASSIDGIKIATADEMKQNLFAVDDVEPFARCLIDLLKNKEKRFAQGRDGQCFVKKHLDIKIAVRKYEQLYLPKNGEKIEC